MSAIVGVLETATATPENHARSGIDRHRNTISEAVKNAPDNIATALTSETYAALAAMQSSSHTHGEYLKAIADLRKANKAITRKDIDDGIKTATVNAGIDAAPDELRKGVEAWPDTVDGAELYRQLTATLQRHCVLPEGGACAVSLWIMASYSIDSFRIFPKLLVHSPQKRCGKTTLLEVLQALMPQALSGSNVTPSVIFRAIELWRVSILLDEVDTFLHNSDDLRGIVNSGHTRSGAYVWRTEGEAVKEPKQFSTWAPMVLAMIGNPPSTILDRSIRLGLIRKTVDDSVQRIPQSFADDCLEIRRQLRRWADDNAEALRCSQPEMPQHDNDRATDNWTALFSIAELIGAGGYVRQAMKTLEVADDESDDLSIELLRDIDELIRSKAFRNTMRSADLAERLVGMTDRPWPECNRGRALTANKLAYLLKPYKIKAQSRRIDGSVAKALLPEDFADAIARYLPKSGQLSNSCAETLPDQPFSVTEQRSDTYNVTEQMQQFSNVTDFKNSYVTPEAQPDAVSDDCYRTDADSPSEQELLTSTDVEGLF